MTDADDAAKFEKIGRLSLWNLALDQVSLLLETAQRARASSNDPIRRQREEVWNHQLSQFLELNKGVAGAGSFVDHLDWQAIQPCPFPSTGECYLLYDHQILLAATIFGQLYKSGSRQDRAIASNRSMASALQEVELRMLETSSIAPQSFYTLKNRVLYIRDKVVGHADGTAFEMKHGHPISSHKSYYSFSFDLDVPLWQRACRGMAEAISVKRTLLG
jgi:hypothetical protein